MYGATKEQWGFFVTLGLTKDLLPVVSNPDAKISASSSLGSIGKVPSHYNQNKEVVGIPDWTTKNAKQKAIDLWSSNDDYGICIQTRHLRAIDVDIENEKAEEIKGVILDFFPDAVFRTRPNSNKFLFPFFLEGEYPKRILKTEHGIIEFLLNGQQFIAAGTHNSGVKYELPLVNYPVVTQEKFEELFKYLSFIYNADESLSSTRRRGEDIDCYDEALEFIVTTQEVRKVMRSGHLCVKCPNEDEHSSNSGPTSTIWLKAGSNGYPNGGFKCLHAHCADIDTHEYLSQIGFYTHDLEAIPPETDEPEFDVLNGLPKGLIKDTSKWIISTALYPQPELAVLNTITFAGAVFGRRYALKDMDTRTNIYTVGIAETGGGKDHSRRKIAKLALEAGLERYIGHAEIRSGQGVVTALSAQPSFIMMLDEFGMLLSSVKGNRSENYMKSTAKILTQLYSSSSSIYKGGVFSDKKQEPIIVNQPNLCIYGTSTLVSYQRAMDQEAIDTGELNRYIVIKPKTDYPDINFDATPDYMDQSIIKSWSRFNDMFDVGDLTGEPTITKVDYTFDMRELLQYQRVMLMKTKDGTGPLYARYAENAIKLAMILAIADSPVSPIVSSTHMDYARSLMSKATDFIRLMMSSPAVHADRSLGSNPNNEKVYSFLKEGKATKRDIYRRYKWIDTSAIDKAIENLEKQGLIKREANTSGRPTNYYSIT